MSEITRKPNVISEVITTSFATLILGGGISAVCILLDKLLLA